MWKKSPILILILIIAVAAFFRLYKLAEIPPGLYPDEAMNGNNALEALATNDFKIFYEDNNGREGLFINIQAVFLKFLLPLTSNDPEPWMLRIVSALFGIFTVLGLYFLTKELFSENQKSKIKNQNDILKIKNYPAKFDFCILNSNAEQGKMPPNQIIALISTFLLAISFWHINFSRIGFRAIMAPAFLVWGLYFLLKSLRQIQESKSPKFYILNSIFSAIFYGLGFHSYIAYRVTPVLILLILIFYLIQNREKIVRKKLLLSTFYFLLSAIIIALPLGLYFLAHPQYFMGRGSEGSISILAQSNPLTLLLKNVALTLGMFNIRGDCNWRHNYACAPHLDFITGIFFLIGLGYSIWQILKKHNYREENTKMIFGFWILAFGFLLMLSPAILSAEGLPHAIRTIGTIPFVYIFVGLGAYIGIREIINILKKMDRSEINKLFGLAPSLKPQPVSKNEKRFFEIIIIAAIAFLFINQTYYFYFINWAGSKNVFDEFSGRYVEIGKYLNALPDQIPKYVVINIERIPFEERYSGRKLPMAAATVMFITNSFLPDLRAQKNIRYLLPGELEKTKIEDNAAVIYLEPKQ